MAVRILLAENHRIMREGLRTLIEQEEGYEVVGEAENGRECVDTYSELHPDVVIMDVSMPELNGIDATGRILQLDPHARVLALSMHTERPFVTDMLEAGAMGYLVKSCAPAELFNALEAVAGGDMYLSPRVAGTIVDGYLAGGKESDASIKQLTPREREVLQLLAEGSQSKEIGRRLQLSSKTVDAHRRHLMEKLEVYSVAELTKFAIRSGLTSIEE